MRPRTPSRCSRPLTAKPVLFVANVGEGEDEVPAALAEHAAAQGAGIVGVSARLEAELSELEAEDAAAMRADLGVASPACSASSAARSRCSSSSPSSPPARTSRPSPGTCAAGLSVWHAAGLIHSDIQKGFVRAEVVGWQALIEAGGYAGARERGTLRLEGRDYVVADGDVITVKFTPVATAPRQRANAGARQLPAPRSRSASRFMPSSRAAAAPPRCRSSRRAVAPVRRSAASRSPGSCAARRRAR